jgi:hypothetical protein
VVAVQEKFSKELFQYILSRVVGDGHQDVVTEIRPSKRFIVGTLAARVEGKIELEGGKALIRASRMKVAFLVERSSIDKNSRLVVTTTGNVYFPIIVTKKLDENNEVQKDLAEKVKESRSGKETGVAWKRLPFHEEFDCVIPDLGEETNNKLEFSNPILEANQDEHKKVEIDKNCWQASMAIERENFDTKNDLISISFTNDAIEPKEYPREKRELKSLEQTLFNCKLKVTLKNINHVKFVDEYRYEDNTQRYYYDFRGINCQAYWEIEKEKLFTEHYGEYIQENIVPRNSIQGLDLPFSKLQSESEALDLLDKFSRTLQSYYDLYMNNYSTEHSDQSQIFQPISNDRQRTWVERKALIDKFGLLLERINEGIDNLRNNRDARISFVHMNETFQKYYENNGIANGKWRLFQLVFILASITSITLKHRLDATDILHVDTGGGKSEAYFGLVVFTMFFERISGKQNGVTALVKFPLRMLSIQQLERVSSIVIYAENVRSEKNKLFDSSEFSIGYYVGNNEDFPNSYSDLRRKLYSKNNIKLIPAPESSIISKCPLCEKSNRGTVRLVEDKEHQRILHICDKCQSKFHIYLTDKEIYRWRPTVIVSTVDKWASLSFQRLGKNLLGANGSMCSEHHGFIPSEETCEDDEEAFRCDMRGNNESSASGPVLSIQDEMHLLREGFGTISSHFEGLVEAMISRTSNRMLKHVTMSATLNGSERQVAQLYNKESFVIPGLCPEKVGGDTDPFFEMKKGAKRIIFGLKPNLRDNHYASLRTILHYCEFMLLKQYELNHSSAKFCETYGLKREEAQILINQFIVPLSYHIKKQDALDMQKYEQEVIVDELNRDTSQEKTDLGRKCVGTPVTGSSTLEELKEVIDSIRKFVKEYDPSADDKKTFSLKPVYSTSVISHGVDLDELNFMIFQGLPYSTSEYIQALSRVGRKRLGLILLWFFPNRVRDDSFFRNFSRYHDTLDHQVKPIPMSRLSKLGLNQTMNSLFCAGILNYLSNKLGYPIYRKEHIQKIDSYDKQDLVEFIKQCYTGSETKGVLDLDIANEVENRIDVISNSAAGPKEFFPTILRQSGYYYYRNQSGMRGIQRDLVLRLIPEDMSLIRGNTGEE